MTNTELKKSLKQNDKRFSLALDAAIAAGYGEMKPSEMRESIKNGSPSLEVLEYIACLEERRALREAVSV